MAGFVQIGIKSWTYLRALGRESAAARDLIDWLIQETNTHNLIVVKYEDMGRAIGKSARTARRALGVLEEYAFVRREGRAIRVNAYISWKSNKHPMDPGVNAWLAPLKIETAGVQRFRSYKISKEIKVA